MNKKFLSLVLALVMVLGTFGNVFAAAATDKEDGKDVPKLTSIDSKVQWLIDNKIVIGSADADGNATGDMELDKPIRRDAVAKMLVYAIGEQNYAEKLQGVYRPFPDVALDNVMNGYIAVGASKTSPANNLPFIIGYEDGKFHPTQEVTYAELAKMIVVTIDKDLTKDKADNYKWTQDWVNRAVELGIFDGLSIDDVNAKAVREDAFAMIYNAFYELKDNEPVPANETRGIISERSDGTTLVLNQGDYKVEYKVDNRTVYVDQDKDAKNWISIRADQDNYYVGSLVRVLSDKDGVVTHIIEMGNPVDGVKNYDAKDDDDSKNSAWVDLGKVTLRTKDNFKKGKVTLGSDTIKIGKDEFDVTDKTEYYVADNDQNILTKVKNFGAAKDLVEDHPNKVYLGYEAFPAINGKTPATVGEARIVVFNEAKKDANTRKVRVAKKVYSSDYLLSVQAPGEKETAKEDYDMRKIDNAWPYHYNFDELDVIELSNNYSANPDVVLDHSDTDKYPIVKVKKLKVVKRDNTEDNVAFDKANVIELEDKDKNVRRYYLTSDTDTFFEENIKVGKHVQFVSEGDKITVLSYVGDEGLDGNLTDGKYDLTRTGTVRSIAEYADYNLVMVDFTSDLDGKTENVVVEAPKSGIDLEEGKEYNFVLDKKNDNERYTVLKAELTDDQAEKDAKAFVDAVNAIAEVPAAKDEAYKTSLENAVKQYKGLSDLAKKEDGVADAAKALNDKIDSYNAIAGLTDEEKVTDKAE